MNNKRRAFLIAASCFCLMSPMLGQNSEPNRIWVPVTVTAHREPVTDLSSDSLSIVAGKTQATDEHLLRSADLPLRLGILIDASRSQSRDFPELFAAAKQFAMSALRGPTDRTFLMRFDIDSAATGWLTREQVSSVPDDQRTGGGTALYDAVVSAVRNHLGAPDWSKPTRRVLVLISDGDDNSSHVTGDAAVMEAIRDGVVIFSFDTNEKDSPGDRVMKDIATRTGAKLFSAYDGKSARKDFSELLQMLDGMYVANFVLSGDTRGSSNIEIKAVGKEKFEVLYPKKLGKQ